jgi:rhamnosyltransferase
MCLKAAKMISMRIAAVVILYHPDDASISNIKSYYDAVSKVYVYDNTENEAAIKKELLQLSKIDYYHDGKNLGLPKRLNEACHQAIKEGFDWLLTMDQDSNFLQGSFTKYLDCFIQFQNKEKVAMFGTSNKRDNITSTGQCLFKEDVDLMTSGTLLNLSLFKKIGNFDEALFIDCVDHDYCIRTILAGYKLIRFSNIFLLHELGNIVYGSSIKTLFLIKKKKEIHSPVRFYYMVRNMLYLTKKFEKENLAQVKQLKKDVVSRIKKAIFYGRNSLEILKYVKKGYKDYKNMKMGKLDHDETEIFK